MGARIYFVCYWRFDTFFLDITGIVNVINQQSRIFETWHSQYFWQYSFGLVFPLTQRPISILVGLV